MPSTAITPELRKEELFAILRTPEMKLYFHQTLRRLLLYPSFGPLEEINEVEDNALGFSFNIRLPPPVRVNKRCGEFKQLFMSAK
jgi:hypothetical protein